MKQGCSMDAAADPVDERTPGCRCAPKSSVRLWLPGFPVALCLLMSLSSVTLCLLMTSKTYELESRLQTETGSEPRRGAFLDHEGTLIPELAIPVGQLVEQVHVFLGTAGAHCFGNQTHFLEPSATDALLGPVRKMRVKVRKSAGSVIFGVCNLIIAHKIPINVSPDRPYKLLKIFTSWPKHRQDHLGSAGAVMRPDL